MFLKYRPARFADFESRVTAARDIFAYNDRERTEVITLWKELYSQRRMHCPIIEDCTPGTGLGCVFLCNLVFVGEDFVNYLRTDAPPISTKYMLNLWKENRLPLLTEREIIAANRGAGVNMLVLASGAAMELLQQGKFPQIATKVAGYHPYALSGFRLNGVYIEMYDEQTYNWAETFGYDCVNDYASYYHTRPLPPENQRPRLYGITAAKAAEKAGAGVNFMFHYQPPRFGFKPTEKELLLWALDGDTDEQLSLDLFLSPETLKKRWQNIYARVMEVAPEIFGPTEAPNSEGRGAEKKRTLLAYLEHHMEELRP